MTLQLVYGVLNPNYVFTLTQTLHSSSNRSPQGRGIFNKLAVILFLR